LNLISDILDLSKIESGTVSVDIEEIFFSNLVDMVARPFRHEAEGRRLSFDVQLDSKLDRSITTDSKRLQQVLKNLLSNAFKFTEQGSVKLNIYRASAGWSTEHPVLNECRRCRRFRGVGYRNWNPAGEAAYYLRSFPAGRRQHQTQIRRHRSWPGDQPRAVQPARREIQLRSAPGAGSTFTFYLPITYVGAPATSRPASGILAVPALASALPAARLGDAPIGPILDDRLNIEPGDATLLIVEDDPHYARIVADLAHDKG